MSLIPVETDARALFLCMARSIKQASQHPNCVISQIAQSQGIEFSKFNSDAMMTMTDQKGTVCQAKRPHLDPTINEGKFIIFSITLLGQSDSLGQIIIDPQNFMASINNSIEFRSFRGVLEAVLEG